MSKLFIQIKSFGKFCKENKEFTTTSIITISALIVSVIALFVSTTINLNGKINVSVTNPQDMPISTTINSSDKKVYDGITYNNKVYIPVEKLNEFTGGVLVQNTDGNGFTVNSKSESSKENISSISTSSKQQDLDMKDDSNIKDISVHELKLASKGSIDEKWTNTPSSMTSYDGVEYSNVITVGISKYHTIDGRYRIYSTNKKYSKLTGTVIVSNKSDSLPTFNGKISILDAKLKDNGDFSKTNLLSKTFSISNQPIEIDLDISDCEYLEIAIYFEDGDRYDDMICGLADFKVS